MKKLVIESLNERNLYRDERPSEPLTYPTGYEEDTISKDEVKKMLKSIIGYSKESGRLCGTLDIKIKTLARKHGIKL